MGHLGFYFPFLRSFFWGVVYSVWIEGRNSDLRRRGMYTSNCVLGHFLIIRWTQLSPFNCFLFSWLSIHIHPTINFILCKVAGGLQPIRSQRAPGERQVAVFYRGGDTQHKQHIHTHTHTPAGDLEVWQSAGASFLAHWESEQCDTLIIGAHPKVIL